jgi:hypothetical protein
LGPAESCSLPLVIARLRLPPSLAGMDGGRAAWLAVAALAADVVNCTTATDFPNGSGIRYWVVWLVAGSLALVAAALLVALVRPPAPRLRPAEALAILAVLAMLMTDVTMAWQPLRDLSIYLRAGRAFLDGGPVYSQTPLLVQPEDRSLYPFLYPPLTLPLFAALALLPAAIAQAVWVGASVALGLWALRLFGLPARWLPAAVVWPPLFQGLWVGNVAVPLLALFALGPWLGAGLVAAAVFKPYSAVAGVWLLRGRRWRQLVAGIAVLAALALLTAPLTGLPAWSDWIGGLRAYSASESALPGLYGFGLLRYLPALACVALAALALSVAWVGRGLQSLARFGVATVVASPSVFGHGMLIAVPAMLSLRTVWLWLAIGFLSTPDGLQWWLAVLVVAASWIVPAMRRSSLGAVADGEGDPLHPLAPGAEAWPSADRHASAPG